MGTHNPSLFTCIHCLLDIPLLVKGNCAAARVLIKLEYNLDVGWMNCCQAWMRTFTQGRWLCFMFVIPPLTTIFCSWKHCYGRTKEKVALASFLVDFPVWAASTYIAFHFFVLIFLGDQSGMTSLTAQLIRGECAGVFAFGYWYKAIRLQNKTCFSIISGF